MGPDHLPRLQLACEPGRSVLSRTVRHGPDIDLNSDLGEGFGRWTLGDDDGLLDVVTSANVACGFHAGDPSIMRQVCERAAAARVAVGAQVGYRDLAGFGRRFIDVEPSALYNAIVHHDGQAAAVVAPVRGYDAGLPVLGLSGSRWLELAGAAGLRTVAEVFAGRASTPEGTLVSRREQGAVLHDVTEVARRCVRLATEHEVVAVDGSVVRVEPSSLCAHSDSPGALDMARAVQAVLAEAGVEVAALAPPVPTAGRR